MLYHTVVLDQLSTLELFAKTMDTRPDLGKHVRRLPVGNLRFSLFGPSMMIGITLETWAALRAILSRVRKCATVGVLGRGVQRRASVALPLRVRRGTRTAEAVVHQK